MDPSVCRRSRLSASVSIARIAGGHSFAVPAGLSVVSHSVTACCSRFGMHAPSPASEAAWSINLRTALFPNLDSHMSHHEAQAERFHCLEQDAVPGVAALPVHESSGIGTGSVRHFDGGGHDLTDA